MQPKYKEAAEGFIKTLDLELQKIAEIKGEKMAMLAKNSFRATQIPMLIMILADACDGDDAEQRVSAVMEGVGDIISSFLDDMAEGMSDGDTKDAMDFADRMFAMQQGMLSSIDSVKH